MDTRPFVISIIITRVGLGVAMVFPFQRFPAGKFQSRLTIIDDRFSADEPPRTLVHGRCTPRNKDVSRQSNTRVNNAIAAMRGVKARQRNKTKKKENRKETRGSSRRGRGTEDPRGGSRSNVDQRRERRGKSESRVESRVELRRKPSICSQIASRG